MASEHSLSSSRDLQQMVRAEQLRLLFETQPFNIAASLIISAILALTLWPVTLASERILLWGALMVAANTVRVIMVVGWYSDKNRAERLSRWRCAMIVGTFLGGAGWGLCNFLLFPVQSPPQQMMLVFITCGVSAGAATSLAADQRVAWSFLLPSTLPLAAQFYSYTSELGPRLSAMGLVYLIFLAGVISRQHNYIKENIALRFAAKEREQLQNEFAQALHSSQEKLRALFELSPLGCILMRTDGSLIEANQAFQQMLSCATPQELEQYFNVSLAAPTEYREINWLSWRQFVERGGTEALECELVRKDGGVLPASVHRMLIDTGDGQHFVWALVEDITERRSHERQLQALNNRLSLATQAGNIGVWEFDLMERTLLWDERMYEIYGVDRATAMTPELAASMAHPDDWDMLASTFRSAMEDPNADRHVLEYRILRPDNNERWVRSAGLFQRDAAGRTHCVIGVAWDITALKRVARMKSEFVSTVSHELRTPLTSIRGSLGLVASGVTGQLPTAAQELIDIAYKNSERLSLLINDILDIEKFESDKMRLDMQPHALRSLLEQTVEANQGFAQNFSVRLTLHIDGDVTVTVDANRFMQIMANLMSNAVKFSSAGDDVEVAVLPAQRRVRIEIRDRGPGIPIEFHERIFQRFSQADASDTRARGGSGLGLAITKTLVEKMNGEIGFVDRPGGGTIFFVEFPCQ